MSCRKIVSGLLDARRSKNNPATIKPAASSHILTAYFTYDSFVCEVIALCDGIYGNRQMKIQPEQYYRPKDPELRQIAAEQTLAVWRHKGRGPAYTMSGSRILYKGADLLAWLDGNRVATEN